MSDQAAKRSSVNPWLIAIAVVIPTFMEILDTTIANVALRYIAGGLAAAEVDAEWVITSYLAANAIVLTISGWLSSHLGRRNYFLISIAVFTIASALCGMATSLGQIIAFRVLQGLAGGGLQPSTQGILVDTFPPSKQGLAMTFFGLAAVIGPIVGPTLGGYLVVHYDWRWIFFINVPIGLIALAMCFFLVKDPDYLVDERAEIRKKPFRLDLISLGLLSLAISCWEVILSKGQQWDWFGDPFWRVQSLCGCLVIGLGIFVFRSFRSDNPLIDLRVLYNRNLAVGGIILFCAFGTLYGTSVALPGMLQTLFGYDAYVSGLVLSPGGFTSLAMMVLVGFLMAKKFDTRYMIFTGLIVLAGSNYWMMHLNLQVDPYQIIWPRMVLTAGLGLIFAPINVACLKYVPKQYLGSAIAIVSVMRNEGGSAGVSVSQIIVDRRDQFHTSRLNDYLDPLNQNVAMFVDQTRLLYGQFTADSSATYDLAVESLGNLLSQQALSLAYFDVFYYCYIIPLVLAPFVFLMRPAADEGDAPAAG